MDDREKEPDGKGLARLIEDRNGLYTAAGVLGLLNERPGSFLETLARRHGEIDPSEIERLVAERAEARKEKDWGRADAIRDHLAEKGILLEDNPDGTTWRYGIS